MILNILLIIILLVVLYRIIFKSNSESYQNPFIYDNKPFIDKNKLNYTPPPYIESTDTPTLAQLDAVNGFVTNNNKLIIDYADDSNFIVDDPNVANVKLLSFIEKQIINKSNNKCMDLDGASIIMKSCDTNQNSQIWSLVNDYIRNMNTNRCLSYNQSDIVYTDCNASPLKEWITDTKGRIHSLNEYNKCLEVIGDNIKVNTCVDTSDSQKWYSN
jgi:hypothetical protein